MLFDSLDVVGAALARFVVELLPENFSIVVGVIDEEIIFHISAGKCTLLLEPLIERQVAEVEHLP